MYVDAHVHILSLTRLNGLATESWWHFLLLRTLRNAMSAVTARTGIPYYDTQFAGSFATGLNGQSKRSMSNHCLVLCGYESFEI